MSTPKYPTRVDLCDGKYTVIYDLATGQSECLRHGEAWRDLCGDKMVLAMFDRIVELEQLTETQREEMEVLQIQLDLLNGVQQRSILLAAQRAEAEREAELYRHVRYLLTHGVAMANFSVWDKPEEVDRRIGAAMAKVGGTPKPEGPPNQKFGGFNE